MIWILTWVRDILGCGKMRTDLSLKDGGDFLELSHLHMGTKWKELDIRTLFPLVGKKPAL